jgi:hypothetical protein
MTRGPNAPLTFTSNGDRSCRQRSTQLVRALVRIERGHDERATSEPEWLFAGERNRLGKKTIA